MQASNEKGEIVKGIIGDAEEIEIQSKKYKDAGYRVEHGLMPKEGDEITVNGKFKFKIIKTFNVLKGKFLIQFVSKSNL